jgi:hypothetical protein
MTLMVEFLKGSNGRIRSFPCRYLSTMVPHHISPGRWTVGPLVPTVWVVSPQWHDHNHQEQERILKEAYMTCVKILTQNLSWRADGLSLINDPKPKSPKYEADVATTALWRLVEINVHFHGKNVCMRSLWLNSLQFLGFVCRYVFISDSANQLRDNGYTTTRSHESHYGPS